MRNDKLLEQIYNDVKALGLVEDQWTFSNMCGRTGTWFSCIKNRNLPMTSDAFLTLSHNIRTRAVELVDAKQHSAAVSLSERLCNLSSGNCIERCSRILASPLYICLCVSAPLFIDFDEDGANEPHERVFIREDPHFGCASF